MPSDFQKIIVKDVLFQYPKLDQPYRFNSQQRRSEPCADAAQNAAYEVKFIVSAEQAAVIFDQIKDHFNECKSRNPKLGKLSKVFGMKKNDDSTVTFTAKKNAMNKSGQLNEIPKMIDGAKQPIEDRRIWSGSTGTIKVLAFPSTDPDQNQGVSLLLDTVQVVHAVYGSDDDDFDTVEGSVTRKGPVEKDDDPFGLPDQSTPSAPPPTSDIDDEIPF